MATRPGYKTTEFWLTSAAEVVGLVMLSGVLEEAGEGSWVTKLVGGVVAVLAALGYTAGRSKVKKEELP